MPSHSLKVLLIDNFDSFTFNIVDCLERLGAEVIVADQIQEGTTHLLLGPGPGSPSQKNIDFLHHHLGKVPILGICLGHQTIGAAFGAVIKRAREPRHGKAETVVHEGRGVFQQMTSPLLVTRYHSLVIEEKSLPFCLEVTARSQDGEIMGIRHKEYLAEGLQFHPESIATRGGEALLRNWLSFK